MKSLIKDNPLGIGLLGIVAVLLLITLLLPVFSGGIPEVEAESDAVLAINAGDITEISPLEPMAKFVVIKQRPLFNEDRKPVDVIGAGSDHGDELPVEDEIADNPLDADLTGVVITKTQRIAILWDQTAKTTIRVSQGNRLDGELSNWSLEKVEARKVMLKNQQGKKAELELVVFTASLGSPPSAKAKTRGSTAGQALKKDTQKKPAGKAATTQADAGKAQNKPMTAADFMRVNLEKRKAARAAQQENTSSTKKAVDK
ncbi:MAG: hypothetical protein IMF09_11415 [Proteobacteria bacterium]|nr:hypothetical protein [Pseudomonadota bacterium]